MPRRRTPTARAVAATTAATPRLIPATPDPALVRRCLGLWVRAVEARDGEPVDPGMAGRVHTKFGRPLVRFTVLGSVDEPVGFALTTVSTSAGRAAYLELLAVDPGLQGHGAGRALLDDAIAAARCQGYERFELDVRHGNTSAIHLYESRGMVATGTRPTAHALPGRPMIAFEMPL